MDKITQRHSLNYAQKRRNFPEASHSFYQNFNAEHKTGNAAPQKKKINRNEKEKIHFYAESYRFFHRSNCGLLLIFGCGNCETELQTNESEIAHSGE
jgi:hypothetical protein